MPLRPTLFDLMSRIVRANANVLLAYRTDFWLHDQYALLYQTKPGDEYVWIMRDHGTELFRLYQGNDAVAVSYWLEPDQHHNRAYHVVCTTRGATARSSRSLASARSGWPACRSGVRSPSPRASRCCSRT